MAPDSTERTGKTKSTTGLSHLDHHPTKTLGKELFDAMHDLFSAKRKTISFDTVVIRDLLQDRTCEVHTDFILCKGSKESLQICDNRLFVFLDEALNLGVFMIVFVKRYPKEVFGSGGVRDISVEDGVDVTSREDDVKGCLIPLVRIVDRFQKQLLFTGEVVVEGGLFDINGVCDGIEFDVGVLPGEEEALCDFDDFLLGHTSLASNKTPASIEKPSPTASNFKQKYPKICFFYVQGYSYWVITFSFLLFFRCKLTFL